jgi:UDP-N-acetylglucosamine enolpyruvyl transferase
LPGRDGRADLRRRHRRDPSSRASSACTARPTAIMPDRIETGTYLCAAAAPAATCAHRHASPSYPRCGDRQADGCRLRGRPRARRDPPRQAPQRLKAVSMRTAPYPGVSRPTCRRSSWRSTAWPTARR